MATTIKDDRDLPEIRPAEVTDGCDYRDYVHLQVMPEAGPPAVDCDLTGATWALTVSDEQGDTAALLTGADIATYADTGVYVEDAATGYAIIIVCAADVTTLGPGDYYYQVTMSLPAGHAYRPSWTQCVFAGTFSVNEAATA
jgi:hypothetical protein